jgi:cbb3-type cytochrome oxidase subunit 3
MDVNHFRIVVMLSGFVLFLMLMAHTYSRSRRAEHDEAAMLPFRSDAEAGASLLQEGTGHAGERA